MALWPLAKSTTWYRTVIAQSDLDYASGEIRRLTSVRLRIEQTQLVSVDGHFWNLWIYLSWRSDFVPPSRDSNVFLN